MLLHTVYNTSMATNLRDRLEAKSLRWYRGAPVPLRVIRRYARALFAGAVIVARTHHEIPPLPGGISWYTLSL